MKAPTPSLLDELSREFVLVCDADGRIVSADDRALRVAPFVVEEPLRGFCIPGTEAKLDELLGIAQRQRVYGCEVPLVGRAGPVTALFSASPHEGGVVLLGSTSLQDQAETLTNVQAAVDELVALNREVTRQKRQIDEQVHELRRVNLELEESNRGVLNLHAELEDRAETLRRNSDVKTRVVANVSHELRTPLHSILGLSKILLDRFDGPLTVEQEKQIRFIRSSAEELSHLVNDLLDLSKLESGKMHLRAEKFDSAELLSALRGMLRPTLPPNLPVELVFEESASMGLETDKGKLSQVLRNLISNAVKFTETGSICVRLRPLAGGSLVRFEVQDTGIGIAPSDHERIFEEFTQLDGPLQRRTKGTGLGLSLSRKLAELLGGTLTVDSELGKGSTFSLTLPRVHPEVQELEDLKQRTQSFSPGRAPVLVVEDDRKTIFVYEKYLALAGFQVVPARTVDEARELMHKMRPAAIVLDIMLERETTWDFLSELKNNPQTADIPILVCTVTNKEQKARALGADEFWLKPLDGEALLRKVRSLTQAQAGGKLLVIDDDEPARYLMRKLLAGTPYSLLEAANGTDGVKLAQEHHPHLIFLDFVLPDISAFDVLDDLKADPRTRSIPVIINTARTLAPSERDRLQLDTEAILTKDSLSRELAINRIRDALRKSAAMTSGLPRARAT